jgi:quercetin dioxygenase-like cupin family protein
MGQLLYTEQEGQKVNFVESLKVNNSISELHKVMEGTFEIDLGIVHNFSDGLYAKQMFIPKGYTVGQHKHKFSHLSILAKGKVIVKTDDFEKEYTAPSCLEIKQGINHTIEALEDSVWFCIHATNETNIDKIDKVLITG